MQWDLFTVIQQILILLTISGQVWVSIVVIKNTPGTSERYVRIMAFCTGLLAFLLCRPLGITFADLMLKAHHHGGLLEKMVLTGAMPFMVGILVSEGTVIAINMRKPIPIRFMLIIAAFTISQASYTNYIAITTRIATLDKAFIPNICYAIAIGMWMTWRYKELPGNRNLD